MRELPADRRPVELSATPFFSQERYQCGPAALATVLQASGAEITLDELVRKVYLPGRRGSLQIEMIAAVRTSGRMPYLIDGRLAAIAAELDAGRPVVVLQNLGVSAIPRWHYAVVIGIDTARDRIILRSGTERRRETETGVFLRTWARGDYWGLVALEPGELPAQADRAQFIGQAAALEQAARYEAAALAWRAALGRWPDDSVALFGLANTLLALEQFAAAERHYRELLAARPGLAAARNNLAMAVARQGRKAEALAEIEQAIATNTESSLTQTLDETRAEIRALAD